MARGRKKLSLDEQLEKITKEIDFTEESLKEMKALKKEIEDKIYQNRLVELDNLISSKGITYDDVKMMLEERAS